MEVAEFRVPLLPELSGTKLISAGGAYVPLLPQVIFGFRMWRCRICFLFLLFFSRFMGFGHRGFRNQARTYSVQVYNFSINWL